MSLKRNIVANYIGQAYVTLVGILLLPMYIKFMGAEAYGLIGFFSMLQAWFGMLDMGLTPTIARETARYHGGVMPALQYRRLYRALSLIFGAVAVFGGGTLFLLSGLVATRWLKVDKLPIEEVRTAVQIMAISVALRWMGGLYRGVVTGGEQLVWLSSFNALMATLRFVCVLPVMWYFGFTPYVFFTHQLLVATLEIVLLAMKGRTLLPKISLFVEQVGWSFKPVEKVLRFALTIAFTSAVWVLVTQTDKLILSGILPLKEYGYFTLAVLAASAIIVVGGPVSAAIMPRMARLNAEDRHEELIRVYRGATQLVTIIAGSAAITLACCAGPLLYAWTGDRNLAAAANPVLRFYAIGNGFLALSAFPYYLQYAKGMLRYHLIGNAVLVSLLIPCIIFAAIDFGAIGAATIWALMNMGYLIFWVTYVHHKLEIGLKWTWLREDIIRIIAPGVAIGIVAYSLVDTGSFNRLSSFIYGLSIGLLVLASALVSSQSVKTFILKYYVRTPSK